MVGIN